MRRPVPSGYGQDRLAQSSACMERGGVTPFNVIPISGSHNPARHPAATPIPLVRWWVRYIAPPGGTVLDPFAGCGTVNAVCQQEGRDCIGFEISPEYADVANARIAAEGVAI